MANFYDDNEGIQHLMKHPVMARIAELKEDYFQADDSPYAPEDVDDALDNYERVLQVVGEISGDFIDPRAADVDEEGAALINGEVRYAKGMAEAMERLSKADLMGFTLPRKYGGLNLPHTLYTAANEIVSRADASLSNLFGLQDISETILDYGDESQKDRYLSQFASGECTGAMVLTEPDAGSDLQAVQLKAEPEDGDTGRWRLNGVKRFITNGCGDILLVLARSEVGTLDGRGLSLYVCRKGPSIVVRRLEEKLGIHGSPTCELQFNNTPAELVGQRRRGLIRYVMALMNGARLAIAAQSLGIGQAAYVKALQYAKEREQFGKAIINFPPVYDMLITSKIDLEAARELTYETSRVVDLHRNLERQLEEGLIPEEKRKETKKEVSDLSRYAATLTPMSKYWASEMSNRVAYTAIAVFGGSGYMQDYDVERHYRDARITSIYEGTTQLQIVAAIGGILSGRFRPRLMEKVEVQYEEPLESLAASLRGPLEKLDGAVEFLKEKKDDDYTDYMSHRVVDLWMEAYVGFLMLEGAARNPARLPLAQKYVEDVLPRIEMNYRVVTSGETTAIENWKELLGA